jgi:hypothetical protein
MILCRSTSSMFLIVLFSSMTIGWSGRLCADESTMTMPVPGDVVPAAEDGRPQLFFDARSTGFARDGKQQVFDGDVIAIGARSIMTADKVVVDQENHCVTAEGHVVVLAADQILTGDKIEYLLDTGDFKISGARMVINDKNQAERISKDVLGFSIEELNFEAQRSARLKEIAVKKDEVRGAVRARAKTGKDASPGDITEYARFLEQEDLITRQENPAFAHMTESRRATLRKRRDYWEQSKASTKAPVDMSGRTFFRLDGDELTRTNGNDFNAAHSLWTPCYCEADETPAWGVRASSTAAQMGGYVTFDNAMIEIKGVPVLYLPWMKLPIKDRRQSGLLPPSFSDDSKSGSGYSQPLFLDLGRDKDATLKADIFERRGMRAGGEFRWKHHQNSGFQLNVEGMRDKIWLKERSNRRDLSRMYSDGLEVARSQPAGTPAADISAYTDREYSRMRLSQRDWWEANGNGCLSDDPAVRAECEARVMGSVRAPNNANRGLLRWHGNDRLGDRIGLASSGEILSDRQYNADVYLPESIQAGFDTGTGERAINPIRNRLTYDGDNYFLGGASYFGDPSRLNDRFEGYQLPLVVQARSRWYTLKKDGVPIYWRLAADDYRIIRDGGSPLDSEDKQKWLAGGTWKRAEASFVAPLTGRTAIQVDHFTDFEARIMTLDGRQTAGTQGRESSLQSWKTGFRFQLPIDGKSQLPTWLGGFSDESGRRVIQHVMNWSMTLATRPSVRRRGSYGSSPGPTAETPSTWFSTDKAGSDDNIPATEYMNEYQLVSFATSHRWKVYSEIWRTLAGEENPKNVLSKSKMSFEEQARRELLYTMDRPVTGANDLFSSDMSKWFTNRYQLLDTDYIEPVNFAASISYDRLKDVNRRKLGRTRDNRPWSDFSSSMGLSVASWSLSGSSVYNIYDKAQTNLTASLGPPGFFDTNVSFGMSINRAAYIKPAGGLGYITTREKTANVSTTLTKPVKAAWSYSRKDKENEAPANDYRQKLSVLYGSPSLCWGIGFAREKGYGVKEHDASYLLQLNITFMGQGREFPNLFNSVEREMKKS